MDKIIRIMWWLLLLTCIANLIINLINDNVEAVFGFIIATLATINLLLVDFQSLAE